MDKELMNDGLDEEEVEAIWDAMFPNMTDEEIEDHLEGILED